LGQKTFAPTTSLSEAISFSGETKNDYAGYPLATAGDVNGDGYDDFIVGACRNNEGGTDAGAMYLILGSENPVGYNLSEAYKFIGEDDYDNAGYSLAGAGDVNGDGYDDIIVGAYKNDADEGDADGAVYLVFGSSDYKDDDIEIIRPFFSETIFKRKRTFQLSKVAHKFFGENNHLSANTGWSVAGAGDINGDGYADFAIGAPKYNVEGSTAVTNGKVYLFEGGTSYQVGKQTCLDAATRWDDGCLTSPSDSRKKYHAYVGSTSNQAGIFLYMHDYDGDGLSDLVIGGNKNLWLIVNPGLDLETEELP